MTALPQATEFKNYGEFYDKLRTLSSEYSNMPVEAVTRAYSRAWSASYTANPIVQNRRAKGVSSIPAEYTRDSVASMIVSPDNNERPLRQIAHALEYSAYPYYKIRKTYQDLLTYHWYITPCYLDKEDAKKDDFKREYRLVNKLAESIKPKLTAKEACGRAIQEGKAFYTARYQADKSHNNVEYAFLQQLPSDWTKIVGFNNLSKYTVAFNMMYFLQPGTDWKQFGELFAPYVEDFEIALCKPIDSAKSKPSKTKYVYAQHDPINLRRVNEAGEGKPEAYTQNGKWFYWVTLKPEDVWTYEIDDVNVNAISPLCGLVLSMMDIADYENIQKNISQNPLVSLLTGTIPYQDNKVSTAEDAYKLSPAGREYFTALWYQMLQANNTGGIGLYLAPAENMRLEQLAEAPNGMQISAQGYGYAIDKSGLAAILPTTSETRAGVANISLMLETNYAKGIYDQFENMMNWIFAQIGLKYNFRFKMFGDIARDKDDLKQMEKSMSLGILSDVMRYNALLDRTIFDDLSASYVVDAFDLLDIRLPLVTSFSAKQENGLPPQPKKNPIEAQAGRPPTEGITSEGKEGDADSVTPR